MDFTSVICLSELTHRGQYSPNVISDGYDKFYITWIDKTLNDVNGDIVLLHYDKNYTMSLLNNKTISRHYHQPKITRLLSGNIVAAWYNDKSDGDGYGVTAKIVDPTLNLLKDNFLVNNFVQNNQLNPSIASLYKSGGFVITWQSLGQDSKSLTHAIYGKIYDEVGNIVKTEFRISDSIQENQDKPIVAGLKDGGFVVVWQSNTQDGSRHEIYAKRYDSSFNDFSAAFKISQVNKNTLKTPNVAALQDGSYIISWQENISLFGNGYQIFAQIYDSDNNIKKDKFLISTDQIIQKKHPGVIGINEGGFVVIWLGVDQPQSCGYKSNFIYGKRFSNNGEVSSEIFKINYNAHNSKIYPSIAALNNNSFVIAWQSFDMNKFDFVTYLKVYEPNFAKIDIADTGNNAEYLSSYIETSLLNKNDKSYTLPILDQIPSHIDQLKLSDTENQIPQFRKISTLTPSDIYSNKHNDVADLDEDLTEKPLDANQQDSRSSKIYLEENKFEIDSLDNQLISNIAVRDDALILQKPTKNIFQDKVITEKEEQSLSIDNLMHQDLLQPTNKKEESIVIKINNNSISTINGSLNSEIFIISNNVTSIKIYGLGGNDIFILYPSNNSLVEIMDYDSHNRIALNDFLSESILNILNTTNNKISIKLPNNQTVVVQSKYEININELNFIFNYNYSNNNTQASDYENYNDPFYISHAPVMQILCIIVLVFNSFIFTMQKLIDLFVLRNLIDHFKDINLDLGDKGSNNQNDLSEDARSEKLDPQSEEQTYYFPNIDSGGSSGVTMGIPTKPVIPLEINTPPPLTGFERPFTPPPLNGLDESRERQNEEPINNHGSIIHAMVNVPPSSIGSSRALQNIEDSISRHALSASHAMVGMPSSTDSSIIPNTDDFV